MSIEIPENMEEVAMKIARAQVRGEHLTQRMVIETAVTEILQSFMDEALEGHYDDVKLEGSALVVYDFMGQEEGRVTHSRALRGKDLFRGFVLTGPREFGKTTYCL